jgi:hypothetical protein
MIDAALQYMFPGIDLTRDCILQDDGHGPYIAAWRRPEPRPTDAEIAAAALPAAQAAKKREIKQAARAHILARYPEWKQTNLLARAVELVSLGDLAGAEWTQMQAGWAWIQATRARSDLLESDVDACTTAEAVEQLTIGGWPE